ncbi:MAG: hypothetical protein RL748_2035 [Pseudomonadota bacterium]|jgi:signal transduction histidine kinase
MELFVLNEQIAVMEAQLQQAADSERLPLLLSLAWQLRQRDTPRAAALVQQAAQVLEHVPAGTRQQHLPRLHLIQAELNWLMADCASARQLAHQALQGFAALGDTTGRADAQCLLIWIAHDSADWSGRRRALEAAMLAVAGSSTDPVRALAVEACFARFDVCINIAQSQQRWSARLNQEPAQSVPTAAYWVQDLLAHIALSAQERVQAIRHFSASCTLALASGQNMRALLAARQIAALLMHFNVWHGALEWMERCCQLARQGGWQTALTDAEVTSAQILHHLQRHEQACLLLRRVLDCPMPDQRTCAILLQLGQQELACQHWEPALTVFCRLQLLAKQHKWQQQLSQAQRGQAQARLELGQTEAALALAQAAQTSARAHVAEQVAALQVLAAIHLRPNHPAAARLALQYLQQALALQNNMTPPQIGDDLLDQLADAHASLGQHQQAFEFASQAAQLRQQQHERAAANRTLAMQVSHQSEQAGVQEMHARQLAAEARRAEILQQTSATLEHLGAIGQEITAHLEVNQVFEVLQRHVHHLLDVSFMAIFLMEPDGSAMQLAWGRDGEQALPAMRLLMDDSDTELNWLQCVREQQPVLQHLDPTLDGSNWIPGSQPTLSRMSAPLCLGEQVLGMITIQSRKRNAYGPREEKIFRTLCAYSAIALSNADTHGELAQAHQMLQATQQQLILQEKMAGLGTLTAGVAHEINNPTNFVHVAAQNQRVDIAEFAEFVAHLVEADTAPEILQAFDQRFARLQDNIRTMLNGTGRIKTIVQDLRAFTRLGASQKQALQLSQCLHSTLNLVRASWLEKVEFSTEFGFDPVIECWPALLNQVFMNLLVTACQSIDQKRLQQPHMGRGKLVIRLRQQGNALLVQFEDNGIGMDGPTLARMREPFFTPHETGTGTGSGMGLSVAFGIVQKHGGQLDIKSVPGAGSCFSILLPLA